MITLNRLKAAVAHKKNSFYKHIKQSAKNDYGADYAKLAQKFVITVVTEIILLFTRIR